MSKLVVIEEENEWQDCLANIVESLGYDVLTVSNFDQAIQVISNCQPKAILVDCSKSNAMFYKFLAWSKEQHPSIKIALYSGNNPSEVAKEQGIEHWFHAPFDIDEIKHVLEQFPNAHGTDSFRRLNLKL